MKQLSILLLLLLAGVTSINAQNADCKVLLDSIKGTYEGGCKNGKADGTGKSIGTDTYDGEFKNGLPDGKGKYTWANGDFYYGGWKKGYKEGKGQLHLPVNGIDSVIYGYWSKGVYKGKYERPYVIGSTSFNVGRIDVSKLGNRNLTITIETTTTTGIGILPLSEIRTQTGSYNTKSLTRLTNKEINILQNVIFPFKATFVFQNTMVELEFLEEGEWIVQIPLNQQ